MRKIQTILCTYQWFAPWWGTGNPRELDVVKRKWVGFWHPQRSPGWEIWLGSHLEKWRGPGNEWVVRHLGKYPEVICARDGWTKGMEWRVALQKCYFLCPSVLCLKSSNNRRYFSFSFEKKYSHKNSFRSKSNSYLPVLSSRDAALFSVFIDLLV